MINAVKKVVKLVKTITDSEIFIDDTNDIMQKIKNTKQAKMSLLLKDFLIKSFTSLLCIINKRDKKFIKEINNIWGQSLSYARMLKFHSFIKKEKK